MLRTSLLFLGLLFDASPALAASDLMGASPGVIVEPDYAIRNLPTALLENRPYLVTPGSNREQIEARQRTLERAFGSADE